MMGMHYVYRLYDAKSGALLHEGTPTELVAKGLFPDRDRLQSEYMRQKKTVKKPRIWRIEREKMPPADTKTQLRAVWEYTLCDAEGNLMAKGTAAELVEQGFFDCTQTAANWARKGCCPKHGVAKMTRERVRRGVVQRNVAGFNKPSKAEQRRAPAPKPKKKAAKSGIEKIADPDALQLDVHDLCGYNAAARKRGMPELSYGVWAAKGKPTVPEGHESPSGAFEEGAGLRSKCRTEVREGPEEPR